MKNGFLKLSINGAILLAALALGPAVQNASADTAPGRLDYGILSREQSGLANVLTDGETDLSSALTRLDNNSLHLSAEDAARAASKVAHLRAMAQIHPERCARTTGHFLTSASLAQSSLTNNFFSNIKPRIIKLEDGLNSYLRQLDRLDPKLAAELRQLMQAYAEAAAALINGNSSDVINYDPGAYNKKAHEALPDNTIIQKVDPGGGPAPGTGAPSPTTTGGGGKDTTSTSGGGKDTSSTAGGGGNNTASGGGNNTAGGGAAAGTAVSDPHSVSGAIHDSGGKLLNKKNFLDSNTYVDPTTSDTGILTREEKVSGDLVHDGSGGATWKSSGSKVIDWQFNIEASDTGFTLADHSSGAADADKGFSVESWNVVDPSGKSQDFPGSTQLKYTMSASGKYVVTAKVMTNLKTEFSIFISPVNN